MRYVRTKNSIREIINDYGNCCSVKSNHRKTIGGFTIIYGLSFAPRADTIEELCDEFVVFEEYSKKPFTLKQVYSFQDVKDYVDKMAGLVKHILGAIWTDKGLIYVAKMNDKGELELL